MLTLLFLFSPYYIVGVVVVIVVATLLGTGISKSPFFSFTQKLHAILIILVSYLSVSHTLIHWHSHAQRIVFFVSHDVKAGHGIAIEENGRRDVYCRFTYAKRRHSKRLDVIIILYPSGSRSGLMAVCKYAHQTFLLGSGETSFGCGCECMLLL